MSDELVKMQTLRAANEARQKEWDTGGQITLAYRGNELAGEVGEACNVIKKLERERMGIKGSRDTKEHLAEELADIVICTDLIAMDAGVDLDAAVAAKFNATSEKVGLKTRYEPEAADRIHLLEQQLKTAREDALEEAAKWHDDEAERIRLLALDPHCDNPHKMHEAQDDHINHAAAIRSLGEKE